jgi:hypothetical protein
MEKGDHRSMNRKRCWGIGLGRTGTLSLCYALVILGYRRVLHNPFFEELASLDGGADLGVALYYKYLDYKFPGSKFVLTLRDLGSWLESMEFAFMRTPLLSRDEDVKIARREDVKIARRMLMYETVTFDRDRLIAAYHRHHADVRRYFLDRPDDLLEMNIIEHDQWDKLSPFLGLPIPTVPFPREHSHEQILSQIAAATADPGS